MSKLIPNFGDRISPFYASPRDNIAAEGISEEASSALQTDSEFEESDRDICEFDEREYEGLAEKREAIIGECKRLEQFEVSQLFQVSEILQGGSFFSELASEPK